MSFILLFFDTNDLSVAEVADRLARAFGGAPTLIEIRTTPPIEVVPAPDPPPPARHNFAPRKNQEVINIFARCFGSSFGEVLERAGLVHMAESDQTRAAIFSGPDIEQLSLSEQERAALIRAL